MNNESRVYNTSRNLIFGVVTQAVILLINFIGRSIFIKVLGEEYLGINGLYTNILMVLSLAELGLGNVMLYRLYKPIEENNTKKISALIHYYKKLYTIIAFVILGLGLALVPFLSFLVKSDLNIADLRNYYIIYLLNSVFSYINIYKSTLINADQRMYIVRVYTTIFTILQNLAQILIIVISKNYYAYLFVQLIFTIINNTYIGIKADKLYPFISKKEQLDDVEKKDILTNMKSMLVYKIGTIILNNTDNILISIILGTVFVGYYSNYSMIVSAISTVLLIVTNAMFSSIGSLNATDSKEKKIKLFNVLVLMFHWITTFCSICLLAVINDFIVIWIGEKFIFGFGEVFAIVFNFYIGTIVTPVWIYRETLGLFNQIKYIMLATSLINIILSIILGKYFGIAGIIIATAISRLVTVFWYEPCILYKNIFDEKVRKYFSKQLYMFILSIVCAILALKLCSYIILEGLVAIIVKLVIVAISVNLIFYIFFRKSEEFKEIYDKTVYKLIRRIKKSA